MEKRFDNNFSVQKLAEDLQHGSRLALSRAITLSESQNKLHRTQINEVLELVGPPPESSIRIGITGFPGVGKSTFIDGFGSFLLNKKKQIAVLAVDPSSEKSGGSILGDKTRMIRLARDERAFIRPSATGNILGGVTATTSEAITLCEAAGFDTIMVETVGIGQNETVIGHIVDISILLITAGGGDELQGIKRGIMEMADIVVVHKSDQNPVEVQKAQQTYQHALHLFPPQVGGWLPPVLTCSSVEKQGYEEIASQIALFIDSARQSGRFRTTRNEQQLHGFHETLRRHLEQAFYEQPGMRERIAHMEHQILHNQLSPAAALHRIMEEK